MKYNKNSLEQVIYRWNIKNRAKLKKAQPSAQKLEPVSLSSEHTHTKASKSEAKNESVTFACHLNDLYISFRLTLICYL